jgi:hypothetical protein
MWTLQNKTYSNLVDHVLIKGSFMGKTLSFCIQRKKKNLITDGYPPLVEILQKIT